MIGRANQSPLIQAELRGWKYWCEDGIPHLVGGALCVVLAGGLLGYARLAVPEWLAFPVVMVMTASMLLVRPASEWLKARLTWPRAGYAAPPFYTDFAATAPVEVISVTKAEAGEMELQRIRKRRQLRFGMMAAAVGMLVPQLARWTGLRGTQVAWFTLACGAAVMLYGVTRLALFLHRHPEGRS